MKKTLLMIALSFIVSTVFIAGFFYYAFFFQSSDKRAIVEIPKGLGLKGIASSLEESGAVADERLFILYVMARGVQNKLKAGEYEFGPHNTISDVTEKLIRADVILRKITIPEGLTTNEIGRLLETNGMMSREDFLEAAANAALTKELLGSSSFEGYLFPDTYSYSKGITPEEFIRAMVSRFKEVYRSLESKHDGAATKLTEREVVILASIIEKETGAAYERPLISAVFHNRMDMGMRLQSDPTVVYGMGDDFDGNLRKRDLETESDYNTYTISGLPPGPIANPGKDSISATLYPAEVDYLYFVSKGDGTHHFSSNYVEHQQAVYRYQKSRK